MMHAPDMSPTLDDALQAWDRLARNEASSPLTDMARVRMFLDQLDEVRDVPALVLDPAQAACMEGAYQAGVRCADESSHVLVVSLPAFLELMAEKTIVSERTYTWAPLDWLTARPVRFLVLALGLGSCVALFADHDVEASAWLAIGAAALVGGAWLAEWLGTLAAPCPPDCEECHHGR